MVHFKKLDDLFTAGIRPYGKLSATSERTEFFKHNNNLLLNVVFAKGGLRYVLEKISVSFPDDETTLDELIKKLCAQLVLLRDKRVLKFGHRSEKLANVLLCQCFYGLARTSSATPPASSSGGKAKFS